MRIFTLTLPILAAIAVLPVRADIVSVQLVSFTGTVSTNAGSAGVGGEACIMTAAVGQQSISCTSIDPFDPKDTVASASAGINDFGQYFFDLSAFASGNTVSPNSTSAASGSAEWVYSVTVTGGTGTGTARLSALGEADILGFAGEVGSLHFGASGANLTDLSAHNFIDGGLSTPFTYGVPFGLVIDFSNGLDVGEGSSEAEAVSENLGLSISTPEPSSALPCLLASLFGFVRLRKKPSR